MPELDIAVERISGRSGKDESFAGKGRSEEGSRYYLVFGEIEKESKKQKKIK